MQSMYVIVIVQYVTQAAAGNSVKHFQSLTRTLIDMNSLELKQPIVKSHHGVIRMRLRLQRLEVPNKYGMNFSGRKKSGFLDLVLQTR